MNKFIKSSLLSAMAIILMISPLQSLAQTKQVKPRSEKLLNGMRVMLFNNNSENNVIVNLRIHSGSAYDPLGKEGVMRLLADAIFPNQEVFDFFREDLGGDLVVTTNYDYIEFKASGPSDKLIDILQTVSSQVINPTIDKETTAKIKQDLLADIAKNHTDADHIADNAAANRLLGDFPYGRPQIGDEASVNKIDFADLIFAKDRFFLADNATIAISGKFDAGLTLRALKRVFGSWQKSDKLSPFTFKQPDEPNIEVKFIESANAATNETRYALRGIARNSSEYAAYKVLAEIMAVRAKKLFPSAFVRTSPNRLPGVLLIGFDSADSKTKDIEVKEMLDDLADGISDAEFNQAKQQVISAKTSQPLAEQWLDAETFGLKSFADDDAMFKNVSKADVSRVAANLAKNSIVTVKVGPAAEKASEKADTTQN